MDLFDSIYQGQQISFMFQDRNVMVNATEMSKLFGKEVKDFMRNEQTKTFISCCLKTENSPFLNINMEEDLYRSKQKSGTWMHRVLALKFAAWLDPDFELWVYCTIDRILFDHFREMEAQYKETASRRDEIKGLQRRLRQHEEFKRLEILMSEDRSAAYKRSRTASQLVERYQSYETEEE